MTASGAPRIERGQTLPDFVVAISIFLVVLAFVIGFIPQLSAPYQDQETPIVAERVASDVSGMLSDERGFSTALDEQCTLAFFGYVDASACPGDPGDSLHEQLSVDPRYSVNVTISDGPSDDPSSRILCADTDEKAIGPCGTDRLARGPVVPTGTHSVAAATRSGVVSGQNVVIEVWVW